VPGKSAIMFPEARKMAQGVNVIGAGLAGTEAAWQLARRGVSVNLYEMRPRKKTPAHQTSFFGELVCSNSLGSQKETTGGGLLQKELEFLDSVVFQTALEVQVPAGNALAVDRERFGQKLTEKIKGESLIEIFSEEICDLPEGINVIATGPLTSDCLSQNISKLTGEESFYFFDAAAPLIFKESIDLEKAFFGSRYDDKKDYINCPFTREEYDVFWEELTRAEVVPMHDFEEKKLFEGCMPVENLARRGKQTLLFGPLKPVGITTPEGKRPFAVVQLRRDNREGTLYNMVGFQTRLKWPEQKRVFRLIPGLEKAEFARFGVMHRNSYLNSPEILTSTLQYKKDPGLFFAGQITGVEGYLESTIIGLWAGINAARVYCETEPVTPPRETASGSLINYITTPRKNFQPINMNFGLLPSLEKREKNKAKRREKQARRALEKLREFGSG